jgi:hypothetical protein
LLVKLANDEKLISDANSHISWDFEKLHVLDQAQILETHLAGAQPGQKHDTRENLLGKAIVKQFEGFDNFSLSHALIANMDVEAFITTNYDTLLEDAYNSNHYMHKERFLSVIKYAPNPSARAWLLKMHGTVQSPDDIVITRENYFRYSEQNAALAGIVQAMLVTKTLLFVGFSLKDENFMRIIDAVRRVVKGEESGKPLAYAVMLGKSELYKKLWADMKFISFDTPGEIESFLDQIVSQQGKYAHILSDNMEGGLGDGEKRPRTVLQEIIRIKKDLKPTLRSKLEKLLREFGYG